MVKFEPSDRIRWATAVRHDPRLRPSVHSVAAEISNHANKEGKANPGKARLSRLIGVSEKTVQRATTALVAYGYLNRHRRIGRSNIYQLMFPVAGNATAMMRDADAVDLSSGHDRPASQDTNDPETYSRPISLTYAASRTASNRQPSRPQTAEESGLGNEKRSRANRTLVNSPNRTSLELALAKKLGNDGFDVLAAIPEYMLEILFQRQLAGILVPADLQGARKLAAAAGANSEHLEGNKLSVTGETPEDNASVADRADTTSRTRP